MMEFSWIFFVIGDPIFSPAYYRTKRNFVLISSVIYTFYRFEEKERTKGFRISHISYIYCGTIEMLILVDNNFKCPTRVWPNHNRKTVV